jgi:mono/diheme cytochrome c family protein
MTFRGHHLAIALFVALPCFAQHAVTSDADLSHGFEQTVKPFVAKYCVACHSGSSPAGGFNLKSFQTVSDVVADLPRWNGVAGRLKATEMPPKGMPQPPAEVRAQVISWVHNMRWSEARKNAGDPGLVLARRLSNNEYNYTIRDLTGVDLRPTREFPVDPANTAGFDNSGETLDMSPSLLNKYLQAAREVGDHMALIPDGIVFAPYPALVETDREKFAIQRIVHFYQAQPTDYADYFEAAWEYKHRVALKIPDGTLADVAARSKVSPKYLPMVWRMLGETKDRTLVNIGPIKKLREMWAGLPAVESKPGQVHAQCIAMRDFVLRIRKDTGPQFAAPVVAGLPPTSQPLMNWKLRQYAAHRRDFDPASLRFDDDPPSPPVVVPKYPGLGKESAVRWAALVAKSRASDPDLVIARAQRRRYETAFRQFANVFPDAFYIQERGRYFPDDSEDKGRLLSAGYHNVMGYFRDDTPLIELILDDKGKRELDRLWDEFDFLADFTQRTWVQYYFNQSGEVLGNGRESGSARPSDKEISATAVIYALRDAYLKKAEASHNAIAAQAIRDHFESVNRVLRGLEGERAAAEAPQFEALAHFAERAYRRPLSQAEHEDLLAYYNSLREKSSLTHEEALRDCIVSVLISPKFTYLLDAASESSHSIPLRLTSSIASGSRVPMAPLSDNALASRLSYFLWSSMPDEKLRALADEGKLHDPQILRAEVHRMLKDERSAGMATEFGGNWLGFRQFETYNSVDRARFPMFNDDLRQAMFEEPVRFLSEVMANDRPVLDLVYGRYTFVNPVLAKFYGMPAVSGGNDHWVRVDDADKYGRGGILPMSVFLTINAPGLRTSPVKRGNWVVRRVIGDEIPAPPPNVPQLPADEAKSDLPVRQMLEKHRSVPFCASCHSRFDSFGLAFEGYGPVGEQRSADLAGRPVDTTVDFPGGSHGTGLDGIKAFIRDHREDDVLDNFSRKLLAYALGRSLMLSDEPLIEQMRTNLQSNGYRFSALIGAIVSSPQFQNKRVSISREQKGG